MIRLLVTWLLVRLGVLSAVEVEAVERARDGGA